MNVHPYGRQRRHHRCHGLRARSETPHGTVARLAFMVGGETGRQWLYRLSQNTRQVRTLFQSAEYARLTDMVDKNARWLTGRVDVG